MPATVGTALTGKTSGGDGVFFDPDCDASESWWKLRVRRGNYYVIRASGAIDGFRVFPVGTDDANLQSTMAFALALLQGDSTSGSIGFRARVPGEMPFYFLTANFSCSFLNPIRPGPFRFEVEKLRILKPPRLRLGRLLEPGSRVAIRIHGVEGAKISDRRLEVRLQARSTAASRWTEIGRKSGVQDGRLTIKARPSRRMRGEWVRVRAVAEGEGFGTVRSHPVRTRIAGS